MPCAARHEAQRAEPLAQAARLARRAGRRAGRAAPAATAAQAETVGVAQLQRHAQQRVGGHADHAHQAQAARYTRRSGCAGRCRARGPRDITRRARPPGTGPDSNTVTGTPRSASVTAGRHAGIAGADDRYARDPSFPGEPELAQRRERGALRQDLEAVALDLVEQRAVDRRHDQPGALRACGPRRAGPASPFRSSSRARAAWNAISLPEFSAFRAPAGCRRPVRSNSLQIRPSAGRCGSCARPRRRRG